MSCKLSDKCDNVFACNILRPEVELLGCNFYKPKKPKTNEEWLCGLRTEEKAEFLVMIQMSVMHPVKRGAVDMDTFIEDVAEWLKQPHTPKE